MRATLAALSARLLLVVSLIACLPATAHRDSGSSIYAALAPVDALDSTGDPSPEVDMPDAMGEPDELEKDLSSPSTGSPLTSDTDAEERRNAADEATILSEDGDTVDTTPAEQTPGPAAEPLERAEAQEEQTPGPVAEPLENAEVEEDAGPAGGVRDLPTADALRALLDGPVPAAMAATEAAATSLRDSANAWKEAGENIRREFKESVMREVMVGGAKLEKESDAVHLDVVKVPKKTIEELRHKHASGGPGAAPDAEGHA